MNRKRNRKGQFERDYFLYKWFLILVFVGSIMAVSFVGANTLLHKLERTFVVENATATEMITPKALTLKEKITDAEQRFNLRPGILHDIIQCESSYRETVYGDNGKAYGIAQFWKTTFDMFKSKSGMEVSYYDTHDQIELTAWAIKEGYGHHWSCYRKLNEK